MTTVPEATKQSPDAEPVFVLVATGWRATASRTGDTRYTFHRTGAVWRDGT